MYFGIYSIENNNYIKNFDYIDINKNLELYSLKRLITKIEEEFYKNYDSSKYYLCISNVDYSKDRSE